MTDVMGDAQAALPLEASEPVPEVPTEVEGPPEPESSPVLRERKKTVKVTRRHLQMYAEPADEDIDLAALRPKSRDDCIDGERPCPFVGCKHHLYLDVNRETGSVTFNFPGKEVEELEDTCALDVAGRGGVTLEDVGNMFNLTRERIRQIEGKALAKLKNSARARALREEADGDDGRFAQGRYKPKYVPSPRAEVRPEPPPPPPPVVSSPEPESPAPIWYVPPSEKPTMPAPMPRDEEEAFELDEPDDVEDEEDEELEEEETDDEPEAEEAEAEAPAPPEEDPMPKKNRPIKVTELTAREALVVKHYLRLAEKDGTRPSPLAIAKACKLEGSSNGSISASVCTALTAAQRKGVKLPYIDEKRARAKEAPEPVRRAPRAKKAPPPPVSEPALAGEVVEDVPSTALVAISSPDAMKNMLLVEKEKLQKKLAAIDVLLTL